MKSVIFYILRERSALVNEMLLMMAGDVESNPGPGEYVYLTGSPNLTSTSSIFCSLGHRLMTLHFTISVNLQALYGYTV